MRFAGIYILITIIASQVFADEIIRVRLQTVNSDVKISGVGISAKRKESPYKTIAFPNMQSMNLKLLSAEPVAKWQSDESDVSLYGYPIVITGDMLSVNGKPSPSPVYLYPRKTKNKIDVVAKLDLESYLLGVLPSEMPARWPLEALKAQAVVARSYAFARLRQAQSERRFHLETNIYDQVFKSSHAHSLTPELKAKLLRAIRETKGEYLVDRKSNPILAFYHADCGGVTENARYVWEGSRSFGTTVDKFCPKSPRGQWTYSIKKKTLSQRLKNYFGESSVEKLSVISKTPSGRNWLLNVKFKDKPQLKVLNSQKLRELVGFLNIKSTKFQIIDKQDEVTFVGLGFGHGAGMCQWGAKALSRSGKTYTQILRKYYPKARMKLGSDGRVIALSDESKVKSL